MQLLQHRISAMQKLGHLPSNIHKNPARGVDWCLKVELGISDLIKLGERDERLKMAAYCDFTVNGVAKLLQEHLTLTDKIDGMSCFGKDKLKRISKLIKDKRTTLQAKVVKNHFDIPGAPASTSNLNVLQTSDDDSQEDTSESAQVPASKCKAFLIYPPYIAHYGMARRLPDCRICKQLESQGDYRDLYDGHHGNYPMHCPRWAEMTMEERLTILQEAGFCDHCLDPRKKLKLRELGAHKRDECNITKRKNRYTCTVPGCSLHSWCCRPHRLKNDELLRAFNDELIKRNQHFTFTLVHSMTATLRGNLSTSPSRASPITATPVLETVVDLSRCLTIPGESTLSIYPIVATAPSSPRNEPDLDGTPTSVATDFEPSYVGLPVPGESTASSNYTLDTTPPFSRSMHYLRHPRPRTPPLSRQAQIVPIIEALKKIQILEAGTHDHLALKTSPQETSSNKKREKKV